MPTIVARALLQAPVPPPIPSRCPNSAFPITVAAGSPLAPGNTIWFTNKTYPPAIRAALEQQGYAFHSQSPAEDFMSKFSQIRVEFRTFPAGVRIGDEFVFDPRQNFRLVRQRDYTGPYLLPQPIVDPDLGIDLSVDAVGRLPLFGFPVVVSSTSLPPGQYRLAVYWTMSAVHNDGLALESGNFLPAGEFLVANPRFIVQ